MLAKTRTVDCTAIGYPVSVKMAASLPMKHLQTVLMALAAMKDTNALAASEIEGVFDAIAEVLAQVIIDWDATDGSGAVLPITPDVIRSDVPSDLAFWLVRQALAGVSSPLAQ